MRKSADKSLWQPGCSHSNTIYDLQLQKTILTIVLRMQSRHRADLDAAITMRFAASRSKPAPIYARGNIKGTTMKQPFQCNLQPEIQEPHRTTHTGTTTVVAKRIGGTIRAQKRPQPPPPHRRGTFHRRLQPLYTEKHKVSCSGFLPKT